MNQRRFAYIIKKWDLLTYLEDGLSLHKINQEMGSCDKASNNGDKKSERLSFMSDVWNT